jgi:hypothetical protein
VVLSRDNLTLHIELVGERLLVSLVDLTTSRVAASTKIDQVPADREAAVATVTHVAADLMMQLVQQRQPTGPTVADERAERLHRERADLEFQRQAIRFGATYDISVSHGSGTVSRRWVTYQGDLDQDLPPVEFYRLLGRPELAREYQHRHDLVVGAAVVIGVATIAGAILVVKSATPDQQSCQVADPSFGTCIQANEQAHADARSTYLPWAGLSAGVMLAAGIFGAWYAYHLHPISEHDAKTLADQYNQNLRHNLGLPVVDEHRLHDVKIAPYVGSGEGGLALGGRW